MKKETEMITMNDGIKVALHKWIPESEVKAVVQLSHGMAEYALRYDRLGNFLVENGIALYAHDHRGHGETAGSVENCGFLSEREGFQRVVLDLKAMIDKCHNDFPEKKVFLFGHSFGSFVSQSFIEQFGNTIDACILCGTAGPRLMLTGSAKILSGIVRKIKGAKTKSFFFNNLTFGSYNNRFKKSSSSNFAWLSRDVVEVQKYENSPYCGFVATNSFFNDFFTGLTNIHKKKNMMKIPKKLPIFIIAGSDDPVGEYGKSVVALFSTYQKLGIEDVSLKLYENCRHEILNELNKDDVQNDILVWLQGFI